MPGGWPHHRGTGGVTSASIRAIFPLPSGRPRLRSFGAPAHPTADMAELGSGGEEEVDLVE
jgi:hypothetical protein